MRLQLLLCFNTRSNNKYIYKLDNKAINIVKQFVYNCLLMSIVRMLETLFAKI